MAQRSTLVLALLAAVAICGAAACKEETKLTITGVEPKEGPMLGGDPVTIKGTGFRGSGTQDFAVYFGKRRAKNCTITSNTSIRCEAPAGEEGQVVDVVVEFGDARKGVVKEAYKYIVPTGPGGVEAIAPGKKKDGE